MAKPVVAVVGAGLAGTSAALALARAGAEVKLFEQYRLNHKRGSSHGPSRLFRLAYFEKPEYVPLLNRALELWRELEAAAGTELFVQSGLLEAGQPGGPLLTGLRAAAAIHDLTLERFSAAQLKDRFPWFEFEPGAEGMFEVEAGYLLADKVLQANLDLAGREGAQIHAKEEITGCHPSGAELHLHTNKGAYRIDKLVLAPGTWARSWLGEALPITVLEKSLFWFAPGKKEYMAGGAFTPFAIEGADERFIYGIPALDKSGVKMGEHTRGREIASAEARTGKPTQAERAEFKAFVKAHIPGIRAEITHQETCLYEMSPDGNFVVDVHPESDHIVFAAGLSGHGFKFGPVLGELLAGLALEKAPSPDAAFLKLDRFKT